MRDFWKLEADKSVDNLDLQPFKFDAGNNKSLSYISIPALSDANSFKALLRNDDHNFVKKIIHRLSEKLRGETSEAESTAAEWLLGAMASSYEDEYICVAQSQCDLMLVKRMTPEMGAALMSKANLSLQSVRTISRYARAHLNRHSIFPVEKSMTDLVSAKNLPQCKTILHENKRVLYSWEGVEKTIINELPLVLDKDVACDAKTVDVVCGGDQGQGCFKGATKLIFRNNEKWKSNEKKNYIFELGTIEFEKDSYRLLNATIFPTWNGSLHELARKKYMVIDKNPTDNKDHPYIIELVQSLNNESTSTTLSAIKIENTVMSSDIAFYTDCLGKVNMCGSWCHMCKLSWKQWQPPKAMRVDVAAEHSELWTIEGLKSHGKKVEDNAVGDNVERTVRRSNRTCNKNSMKPEEKRGVTGPPAIDAIEVDNYIVPTLHVELGMVNHALKKGLLTWIDVRLEEIPPEVMVARSNYLINEIRLDTLEEMIDDIKSNLAEARYDKSDILKQLKERNETRGYLLPASTPERRAAETKRAQLDS
mmetsp:Transcript_17306/g.26977  ORF Transcript_17306/g.26977 Transcript_17306/m.26977 type:complete len:535 (+) Transcript_17306:370-1974(+)